MDQISADSAVTRAAKAATIVGQGQGCCDSELLEAHILTYLVKCRKVKSAGLAV
jgi:hypothetical protein